MTRPSVAAVLAALLAVTALLGHRALPAEQPQTHFVGVDASQVLELFAERCQMRGLAVLTSSRSSVICGAGLRGDERFLEDLAVYDPDARINQQMVEFRLTPDGDRLIATAVPWVEVMGPGGEVRREDITSRNYLLDLQALLHDVSVSATEPAVQVGAGPWRDHYDSEDDWRLDAHRRAVDSCDRRLADMDRNWLEFHIEAVGVRPFSTDVRGRCEELFETVYLWGLARGMDEPEPEDLFEYLEAN